MSPSRSGDHGAGHLASRSGHGIFLKRVPGIRCRIAGAPDA
jgi:hypothetical protein